MINGFSSSMLIPVLFFKALEVATPSSSWPKLHSWSGRQATLSVEWLEWFDHGRGPGPSRGRVIVMSYNIVVWAIGLGALFYLGTHRQLPR